MDLLLDQLKSDAIFAIPECGEDTATAFNRNLDDLLRTIKAEWDVRPMGRPKLTLPRPKHGIAPDLTQAPLVERIEIEAETSPGKYDEILNAAYKYITSVDHTKVETPWLVLLTDASLMKALDFIHRSDPDKVDEAISTLHMLDKAIITTGGPGSRLAHIHTLIEKIRTKHGLDGYHDLNSNPKDTKNALIVPNTITNPPSIQFPCKRYSTPPSIERFQQLIQDAGTASPFIIENAISFWTALLDNDLHSWRDLDYLRHTIGHHRLVPVEIGSQYTDKFWNQKFMQFGDYLDQVIIPSLDDTISEGDEDVDNGLRTAYLAQHNLFKQAPALRNDIQIPDYIMVDTGRRKSDGDVVFHHWFGPKDTVTPLHFDASDNLLAQVVGFKYIRLYSPKYTENLYPYPSDTLMHNTSQVDIGDVDTNKFPRFVDAPYTEAVIGPGDLIYIPPNWWHYLRSLSVSISVSVWF